MKHRRSSNQSILLLSVAIVLALSFAMLLAALPVSAQVSPAEVSLDSLLAIIPLTDSGNPPVNNGCIQDAYIAGGGQGGSLNCTAEDVRIANVTNITILDDGCAFPGDTVTFTADYEVETTATSRYDVGLYFATDGDPNGDGALSGQCTIATLPYAPDPPWLDLDGLVSGTQDTCGDIDTSHNPLYPNVTLTAECIDVNGDGRLDVATCTSWRQDGANDLCTTPTDAFPGAPSKCKCDAGPSFPIEIPGQIIVDKVTVPPGAGHWFYFSLTGTPTNPVHPAVNVPFHLTDADPPFESASAFAGTYQITEASSTGWTLTSVSCTSDNATPDDASDDVTFDYANGADLPLTSGETIRCTFTNTAGPTSVQLADFSGTVKPDHILLSWETVSEIDNLGFNIYRSDAAAGAQTLISATLIPANNPGATQGSTYSFQDSDVQPGVTYYYWLEDLDTAGQTSKAGPVAVTFLGPTSVGLNSFTAVAGTAPALLGLGGVAMAALAGLAVARRKQD